MILELIQYACSSFWRFVGCISILALIGETIEQIVKAICKTIRHGRTNR